MIGGIAWPMPDPTQPAPGRDWLDAAQITGAEWLRPNVPIGCDVRARLEPMKAAGWKILAMLDLPRKKNVAQYVDHAGAVAETGLADAYELGNEWLGGPDAHCTPEDYAEYATSAARTIRQAYITYPTGYFYPDPPVWLAGEVWRFDRGEPLPQWEVVRTAVPTADYRGVAIHPYRDPHRPDWVPNGMEGRIEEWGHVSRAVGYRPLIVTEVGWSHGPVKWWKRLCVKRLSPETQAAYLRREVAILRALGAVGVFVYAFAGDYGVLTDERKPIAPGIAGLFHAGEGATVEGRSAKDALAEIADPLVQLQEAIDLLADIRRLAEGARDASGARPLLAQRILDRLDRRQP